MAKITEHHWAPATMKIRSIGNPELGHLLARSDGRESRQEAVDLAGFLCDILRRANDFVPSQAGAILLSDPPAEEEEEERLVVVAGFGDRGAARVGFGHPAGRGIAGQVFASGQAMAAAASSSETISNRRGAGAQRSSQSVLCAPLSVKGVVVGVLELIDDRLGAGYGDRQLALLEIFAETISASLTNAVAAQRSRELARRDDLTGLYNDRYMHQALSEVVQSALGEHRNCGLVFIDLDTFKGVNDAHGHLCGSRLLRELGSILRQVLPGAAIAARYGGDEFVIILSDASKQELVWVAESVRQSIETHRFLAKADPADPSNYPAVGVQITASLGLAALREDVLRRLGEAREPVAIKNELLRLADARMYCAKELGKNRIVFVEAP